MNQRRAYHVVLTLGLILPGLTQSYPLDGYPQTGIRRLEASRLAHQGAIKGPKQPPGALLDADYLPLQDVYTTLLPLGRQRSQNVEIGE